MKRHYIILIIILLLANTAYSQDVRTEILLDFRVNSTTIDPSYEQNASRLDEIEELLNSVLKDTVNIKSIYFCGTASPEGSYQVNRRLAKGRMDALEKVVRSRVDVPEALIMRDDMYIPWEYLADLVSGSDMAYKNEVLEILRGEHKIVPYNGRQQIDSRIPALKKLGNGKVWNELNLRFFHRMRNASVVFVTYKPIRPEPEPIPEPEPVVEEIPVPEVVKTVESEPEVVEPAIDPTPEPAVEEWGRKLYVKTNALGWGLAIANAAVETDLCKHWSFNLPVYYPLGIISNPPSSSARWLSIPRYATGSPRRTFATTAGSLGRTSGLSGTISPPTANTVRKTMKGNPLRWAAAWQSATACR